MALPALMIVLALCLGGLVAATVQLRAHDAATIAARLLGRGEPPAAAAEQLGRLLPGARLSVETSGELVCARVSTEHRIAGIGIPLSARSCVLDGGR